MTTATHPTTGRAFDTEILLRGVLALMLGLSNLSFIEPSPYEIFFFVLVPVLLINQWVITRITMTLFWIIFTILFAEVLCLTPYFQARAVEGSMTPSLYTAYTLYLYLSAFVFALVFSKNTKARLTLSLKAYAFSCVFAGAWGILSYLNVAGIGDREPIVGRVAGPFKDPNVLGTYCIMGALYLMQAVVIGAPKYRIFKILALGITLFGGVFLSFSRGSMGATVFGALFLGVSTYVTADSSRMRRKIILSFAGIVCLVIVGGFYVASNSTLRQTFTQRAQLEQDYDGGTTGRFGNQRRSIPMLLERPLGFGPRRFAIYFDLDPHNSYLGAFSSGGWLGGFAFLFLALSTSFLALRLAFVRSPFLREAQVVTPAMIGIFLQALQIDVDHWRFVFLMLGAIWGTESARIRLLAAPRQADTGGGRDRGSRQHEPLPPLSAPRAYRGAAASTGDGRRVER